MTTIKSYTELLKRPSFEERYDYLRLGGLVGAATFGSERYLNQKFYTSSEWRRLRSEIIVRDEGLDLGIEDVPIAGKVFIHHMNPIVTRDFQDGNSDILDPEYLISVSHRTHNAIHYGDARLLPKAFQPRQMGDTRLW